MPLIEIKEIGHGTTLGIWQYDDSEPDIETCPQQVRAYLARTCRTRQAETVAVYSLLKCMTGTDGNLTIDHEESGRPFLKDTSTGKPAKTNIGISHTNGFASIIISTQRTVAIDIEHTSIRVYRIAKRFLRPDEQEHVKSVCGDISTDIACIRTLLVYWCAKETIYKYYSDPRLTPGNIKIEPCGHVKKHGHAVCTNMISQETKNIEYDITDQYVVTYCM